MLLKLKTVATMDLLLCNRKFKLVKTGTWPGLETHLTLHKQTMDLQGKHVVATTTIDHQDQKISLCEQNRERETL